MIEEGAIAPSMWLVEVLKALLIAERRGRINRGASFEGIALAMKMPVQLMPGPSNEEVLAIAEAAQLYKLTAYDAGYLALALRAKPPLATLDRDMAAAAVLAGVEVVTVANG